MRASKQDLRRWLALTILPVVLGGIYAAFVVARGPVYLFAYDPDYPYLLNALNLAQSLSPRIL